MLCGCHSIVQPKMQASREELLPLVAFLVVVVITTFLGVVFLVVVVVVVAEKLHVSPLSFDIH